jgi:hypothetical protein
MPLKDPVAKKLYRQQYYQKNKENIKNYQSENRDKYRENARIYRENNKEYFRIKGRERRQKNKALVAEQAKIWWQANPNYRTEYRKRKGDTIRQKSREYLSNNPSARMARKLRERMRLLMKGVKKSGFAYDLIGCDTDALKAHLESQFTPGMTWENYGKDGWHVDHIVPCSLFDLSHEYQQRACFNWQNLQPLWKRDNLSKHNTLETCPV